MLFETPEDTYNAYQKFLRKKEYKKAYRCLEKMLNEFHDDAELLENITELCLLYWDKPDLGKRWLLKLIKIRSSWLDYMLLSRLEAEAGNIGPAKEYLKKSKSLQRTQSLIKPAAGKNPKTIFAELEDFIKFREWEALAKKTVERSELRRRRQAP
jgi:tetratricopeptide (TPR) repeat protein